MQKGGGEFPALSAWFSPALSKPIINSLEGSYLLSPWTALHGSFHLIDERKMKSPTPQDLDGIEGSKKWERVETQELTYKDVPDSNFTYS